MDLAKRLLAIMKEQKMTEAELGQRAGVSQQAINKIIRGETKKPRHLLPIASALQVEPIWLLSGLGFSHPHKAQNSSDLPNIPIYATSIISEKKGILQLHHTPHIADQIKRPPSLASRNGLYGLYIQSNHMLPRFKQGEIIIADAYQPPQEGDDCVIQKKHKNEGYIEVYIKNYLSTQDDYIHLQQYHPPTKIQLRQHEVILHRIITIKDIFQ